MDARSHKRQRTASARESGLAKTGSSALASLPDELLVQIFGHLDSISRKKIERVCWRWKNLVRETGSLRDHVKIDLAILPRRVKDLYDVGDLLRWMLKENPSTRLIHFTHSGLSVNNKNVFLEHTFLDENFLDELSSTIGQHAWPMDKEPHAHLLLEKVSLEMDWAEDSLLMYPDGFSFYLEFRDVTMTSISLQPLLGPFSDGWPGFRGEMKKDKLRVTGSVHLRADHPIGYAALMTLVDQSVAQLTTKEKRRFRRIMAGIETDRRKGAAEELDGVLRSFTNMEITPKEAVTHPAVTPFLKRLIIGARHMLDYFDLHSQPVGDYESDDGPDDEDDDENDDEDEDDNEEDD